MARILIGNIRGPKGDRGETGQTGPMGPAGPQGPLPPLVDNYLQSDKGAAALDAIMGKKIDERIKELAEKYTQLNSEITTLNSSTLKVGNIQWYINQAIEKNSPIQYNDRTFDARSIVSLSVTRRDTYDGRDDGIAYVNTAGYITYIPSSSSQASYIVICILYVRTD